jgi:NADH-quinone oxidoreductase subunit B
MPELRRFQTVRIEDQRSGNGSVPGIRRKAIPIAMATGPAEYTAEQQELPVRLTSLADMVQRAQNWARSIELIASASAPVVGADA